jgi:hypothetical protein
VTTAVTATSTSQRSTGARVISYLGERKLCTCVTATHEVSALGSSTQGLLRARTLQSCLLQETLESLGCVLHLISR